MCIGYCMEYVRTKMYNKGFPPLEKMNEPQIKGIATFN